MTWRIFVLMAVFLGAATFPFVQGKVSPLPKAASPSASTPPTPAEPEFSPLTLDRIFGSDHSLPANVYPSDLRTLVITGDVIPARGVNIEALKAGFTYPWQETANLTKSGDLTIIDLESPLLKNCPVNGYGFTFCGDARNMEGLKLGGVDMVSLENNHITNFGEKGVQETIGYLEEAGMVWGRRDHVGIKEVRGLKFGLLSFNGIGERIDREGMVAEIKKARPQVDVLMAEFHWGKEYERLPKTDGDIAPDDPQEIAHLAVEAGVDLVIGNHPHWVMAVEFYKDHLIPYGHGNFIFDQMWSEETRIGVVGKYTFYKTKLVDVSYVPVKIFNYAQPRIMPEGEAATVLSLMKAASLELSSLTKPAGIK